MRSFGRAVSHIEVAGMLAGRYSSLQQIERWEVSD